MEPPPDTSVWQPETVRARSPFRSGQVEPLRPVQPRIRPRHPLAANDYRGLRDGELIVVPPGQTAAGACGDCGMDDSVVGWCRLCRWCADLRELRSRRPPPNPGKRVRS